MDFFLMQGYDLKQFNNSKIRINMKNSMIIMVLVSTFSLSSTAFSEIVEMSFDDLWDLSIEKILDLDGLPSFRDKELGIIKTDPMAMKLDSKTADCGRMFGIPYIKDKRTKTAVSYQIRLKKIDASQTKVTVKANIDGYFFKNETAFAFFMEKTRDASKVLGCKSTGEIEKQFIESLRS